MVTIVDVARKAAVSISTVSRVVNQPELVVKKTRERVFKTMRELNYSPNKMANSLRSGKAKSVALLVGDISGPFFATLAKALSKGAAERGYNVVLHDLDNSLERFLSVLNGLNPSDARGVIIGFAGRLDLPEVHEAIAAAQQRGIEVVTNSQIVDESIPAVLPQFDELVGAATHYLDDLGVGPIAFVGGSKDTAMTRRGKSGFQLACQQTGRQADQIACLIGDFKVEPSRQQVERLLQTNPAFSPEKGQQIGIVCQTTRMAFGAMLAGAAQGLKVPEQLAIICCEELPHSIEWHPELTTYAVSMDDIAQALLSAALKDDGLEQVTHLIPRLIVRGSTNSNAN